MRVVVRDVVGVLVSVPGPAASSVSVGRPSIDAAPGFGAAQVVVPLDDRGGLLGKPSLRVTVTGDNGCRREVIRRLDTILPANPIDYPMVWRGALAAGAYTVTACAAGATMAQVCHDGTVRLGHAFAATAARPAVMVAPRPHGSNHPPPSPSPP